MNPLDLELKDAVLSGDVHRVRIAISYGANPNAVDQYGNPALDWAIEQGIPHGGWCPDGRLAEDGRIADRYQVLELSGSGYRQRTGKNVADSDGTLIVNLGELDGGTLATQRFAGKLGKPCMVVQAAANQRAWQAEALNRWLHEHHIVTLNIAGPRESKRRGIYNMTKTLLDAWLGNRIDAEASTAEVK